MKIDGSIIDKGRVPAEYIVLQSMRMGPIAIYIMKKSTQICAPDMYTMPGHDALPNAHRCPPSANKHSYKSPIGDPGVSPEHLT